MVAPKKNVSNTTAKIDAPKGGSATVTSAGSAVRSGGRSLTPRAILQRTAH